MLLSQSEHTVLEPELHRIVNFELALLL